MRFSFFPILLIAFSTIHALPMPLGGHDTPGLSLVLVHLITAQAINANEV